MPQIEKTKRKATTVSQVGKTRAASTTVKAPPSIDTVGAYQKVMARINALMDKGSNQLTPAEITELNRLAALAEHYEEAKYPAAAITILAGLIDQKMYDMRLTQGAMARLLGVSDAKLSLILSGRQKLDVKLLKTIHKQLDVDANILLDMI